MLPHNNICNIKGENVVFNLVKDYIYNQNKHPYVHKKYSFQLKIDMNEIYWFQFNTKHIL